MRRNKKEKLIQENIQTVLKQHPDEKGTNKYRLLFYNSDGSKNQVNVTLEKDRRLLNVSCTKFSAYRMPRVCIAPRDQVYSKEFLQVILYHELGHAFLHSFKLLDLELFNRDIYERGIAYTGRHDELGYASRRSIQKIEQKVLNQTQKGDERRIIVNIIRSKIDKFKKTDNKMYWILIHRINHDYPKYPINAIIRELEADLFAASNLSSKKLLRTRRIMAKLDLRELGKKDLLESYIKLLRTILSDPEVKQRLWVYKINVYTGKVYWKKKSRTELDPLRGWKVSEYDRRNRNESKKECIETAQ